MNLVKEAIRYGEVARSKIEIKNAPLRRVAAN